MFNKIFIEREVSKNEIVKRVLNRFKGATTVEIDNYDDIFSKYKKPYLDKRTNLNLFLARKRGALIKEAPYAYGKKEVPRYYFIHAYNCIYECTYCYLQGYFNSPDLVLFVNHEEILESVNSMLKIHRFKKETPVWFHAGEFSDSLALSHITQEISLYHHFFKKNPDAFLELRTKSINIKEIKKLKPLPNLYISFSLASEERVRAHDLKTPSLKKRLEKIKELYELGHPIGIHLDPIIYNDLFEESYMHMIEEIDSFIPLDKIGYISIGVIRFTKSTYHQVKNNYPKSDYFQSELIKSDDGKIKYPRPMRFWILNKVKEMLIKRGALEAAIYLCMED